MIKLYKTQTERERERERKAEPKEARGGMRKIPLQVDDGRTTIHPGVFLLETRNNFMGGTSYVHTYTIYLIY